MTAPDNATERLAAIAELAEGLMDYLPGNGWSSAYAIRQMAEGHWTPAEAFDFTGED